MARTFFTADLHFGHQKIIDYCDRPFHDADHMDQMLVEFWNETVSPKDTVWVLGDVSMVPKCIAPVKELNGTKHLIAGNHDSVHPMHRRYHRYMTYYSDMGFTSISPFARHRLDGREMMLSHFPYAGDHKGVDRYRDYRLKDNKRPLLCGHVHDLWQYSTSPVGTPMLNVGVDVWNYRPVSADQVIATMDALAAEAE
jgi:calcineurin-like phosphoesterase family protein